MDRYRQKGVRAAHLVVQRHHHVDVVLAVDAAAVAASSGEVAVLHFPHILRRVYPR